MKARLLSTTLILYVITAFSQINKSDVLFRQIQTADSLLFAVGFNGCDTSALQDKISDHFISYHDQVGITESKSEFVNGIQNGACNLSYKAFRELDKGSVAIYPLKRNGKLYGAVQTGRHTFYGLEDENQSHLTSQARFTHVWMKESEEWRLTSVLSYDHLDFFKKNTEDGLFIDNEITGQWLSERGIPSVAIGYIENGLVRQTSVFSQPNLEDQFSLNTIWNVASLAKPITALVALKLVDQGFLKLDQPFSEYYSDPKLSQNRNYEQLTLRHILSHQTGLPNWLDDESHDLDFFEFDPGEKYQYSGEGYDLLRRALESIFEKSFQALAEDLIFTPLEMSNTSFVWRTSFDELPLADWHKEDGTLYDYGKFYEPNGADDLLTTIGDYSKFVHYVLHGANLSLELQSEMVADQVRVSNFKHFGLGWWIDEQINEDGHFAIVHGGDDIGVHCIAFILPDVDKGLIIFTNSDNGTEGYVDIVNHFLESDAAGIFNAEMN